MQEANVTPGMTNVMNKGGSKFKCEKCGLLVPKYPGRYPSSCPNCEGNLVPIPGPEVDTPMDAFESKSKKILNMLGG